MSNAVAEISLRDTRDWIECLTGSEDTPMAWRAIWDPRNTDPSQGRLPPVLLFGPISEVGERLTRLNQRRYGIFAVVNKTDGRGQSTENVSGIRALFADSDPPRDQPDVFAELPPLPPNAQPSMVVTSGRGQHGYWKLWEDEDPGIFGAAQRAISSVLGTDPDIHDLPRIMRVPGFVHHKYEPREVTVEVANDVRKFTVWEIIQALKAEFAFERERKRAESAVFSADMVQAIAAACQSTSSDVRKKRCRAYLSATPPAVEGQGGDNQTIKAAYAGGDFGLEPKAFWPLLCEYNSRCSPPWDELRLRKKMESAYKTRKKPMGSALVRDANESFPGFPGGSPDGEEDQFQLTNGDDNEFAEKGVEMVRRLGSGELVATRGALYFYSAEDGVWVRYGETDFKGTVSKYYRGDRSKIRWIGADGGLKSRNVSISNGKLKGAFALANCDPDLAKPGFFDQRPLGVPCENGFVTLEDGVPTLVPHSPDHRTLWRLTCAWDEEAECSEWMAFLRGVFDGDEDTKEKIDFLQEFLGACLLGIATRYQKCALAAGGGSNGKSTFLTAFGSLFPEEAKTSICPTTWRQGEFVAKIGDKAINIVPEVDQNGKIISSKFKPVIVGEPTTARPLYENPYQFSPWAGHLLSTNALPRTDDTSFGFWRRFTVISFNRSFDPADPGFVPAKELESRLAAELPGILLWSVHGAARLMRRGSYTVVPSSDAMIREWHGDVDVVVGWAGEKLQASRNQTMTTRELYEQFCKWFTATDGRERFRPSMNKFGRSLTNAGFPVRAVKLDGKTQKVRMVSLA